MDQRFIRISRGLGLEYYSLSLTLWVRNMLVEGSICSRACFSRPISSVPFHRCPFYGRSETYIFDTPSVAPSSIRVVHGKGQFSGFFFFNCDVSQFNWLPVVSINFFEVNATCHFLIGLCRFICLGQLPIYSGIPLLPFTFLKFSFLTFLV